MNKNAFLIAASIVFNAGNVSATELPTVLFSQSAPFFPIQKATKSLYNQNSNYAGGNVNSQNYTTGYTSYSDQAADDFVIPKGKVWVITEAVVTGAYYNGAGPAISEDLVFYKDNHGVPGAPVQNGTFTNLNGGKGPNFAITLPGKGLKLGAGTYWISVIADVNLIMGGQWGWAVNSAQHGNPAVWQNPGGAFGYCRAWDTIENCIGAPGPDLMFKLRGHSRTKIDFSDQAEGVDSQRQITMSE